ncbi:uncharacterized protein B0T15DRAFT_411718 [Chaetomium strumarium]|uniref:Uncharacterized protein n=1 Tax=Chaetomium strumarium TaxID=1170767 RepID=A0AAJ0GZ72_9PEZI|nr:hypothetical protein B0T15DRAFT_411718 [Chaetomium strumarium]
MSGVGLEVLLEGLIPEIAYSGEKGVSISELLKIVRQYHWNLGGQDASAHDLAAKGFQGSLEDPSSIEKSLSEAEMASARWAWDWLRSQSQILINGNKRWNRLELSEALALPEADSIDPALASASGEADGSEKSKGKRAKQILTTRPRICASEDLVWQTLTRHNVDYKRVPALEWACLQGIAAARAEGILQSDLRRLVGQDKRSLPKRTDSLARKGYIAKRTVVVKKMKTSRLWLIDFAPPLVEEETGGLDLSPETLSKDLEPVPWHPRWTGNNIDMDALGRTAVGVLKAFNVMRYADLRQKMGVEGKRWQMKTLAKNCQRLVDLGVLKYTAASFPGSRKVFKDCIKFVREPSAEEWDRFLATGKKTSQYSDATRHREPKPNALALYGKSDDHGRGTGADRSKLKRIFSGWTPEKPLAQTVFEVIRSAGPEGASNPQVSVATVGYQHRRYLSSYLTKVAETQQPPHLQKFQIVSRLVRTGKTSAYMFSAPGAAEQTAWSQIDEETMEEVDKPAENSLNSISTDPFGFGAVRPRAFAEGENISLSELSRTAKKYKASTKRKLLPRLKAEHIAAAEMSQEIATGQDTAMVDREGQLAESESKSSLKRRFEETIEEADNMEDGGAESSTTQEPAAPAASTMGDGDNEEIARNVSDEDLIMNVLYNGILGKLQLHLSDRHLTWLRSGRGLKKPVIIPVDDSLEEPAVRDVPESQEKSLVLTTGAKGGDSAPTYEFIFGGESYNNAVWIQQEIIKLKSSTDEKLVNVSAEQPASGEIEVASEEITVEAAPPASGATRGGKRGRGGGRGKGKKRGQLGPGGAKPYVCSTCGGAWKNDIGLKYHLEKAQVPCNPNFDPAVLLNKSRKRRKLSPAPPRPSSAASEAVGEKLTSRTRQSRTARKGEKKLLPLHRKVRTAMRSAHDPARKIRGLNFSDHGSEEETTTPPVERAELAYRRAVSQASWLSMEQKPGAEASAEQLPFTVHPGVLGSGRCSDVQLSPTPGGVVPQPEADPSRENGASGNLTRLGDATVIDTLPTYHQLEPLPASLATAPATPAAAQASSDRLMAVDTLADKPLSRSILDDFTLRPTNEFAARNPYQENSSQSEYPELPPHNGEQDTRQEPHEGQQSSKLFVPSTNYNRVSSEAKRRTAQAFDIISYLLDNNGGVFPGDRALFYAVTKVFLEEFRGQMPPTWKNYQGAVKALETRNLATMHTHMLKTDRGRLQTCSLLIKSGVNPNGVVAGMMKQKMREAHPGLYIPAPFSPTPEELALLQELDQKPSSKPNANGEKFRSRRKLIEEVEVFNAPYYTQSAPPMEPRKDPLWIWESERDLGSGFAGQKRSVDDESSAGPSQKRIKIELQETPYGDIPVDPSISGDPSAEGQPSVLEAIKAYSLLPSRSGPRGQRRSYTVKTLTKFPRELGRMRNPGLASLPQSFFFRCSAEDTAFELSMPRIHFLDPNTSLDNDAEELEDQGQSRDSSRETSEDVLDGGGVNESQAGTEIAVEEQQKLTFVCPSILESISKGSWADHPVGFFEHHGTSFTLRGWMPGQRWLLAQNLPFSAEEMAEKQPAGRTNPRDWIDRKYAKFCCLVNQCAAWEQSPAGTAVILGSSVAPADIYINVSPSLSKVNNGPVTLKWSEETQYDLETLPYEDLEDDDYGDVNYVEDAERYLAREGRSSPKRRRGGKMAGSEPRRKGGRPPKLKLLPIKTMREHTAYPKSAEDFLRAANEEDEELDWSSENVRLAAFIVVTTLLGGVDRVVDWGLMMRLMPDQTLSQLRHYWGTLRKDRQSTIVSLTEKFRRAFLKAYENNEVPPIDFDNVLAYDWKYLIKWTTNLDMAERRTLPSTREALEESFTVSKFKHGNREWREAFYHPQRSSFNKFQDATSEPLAIAVDGIPDPQQSSEMTVAMSWTRSLCVTPVEAYTAEAVLHKRNSLFPSRSKTEITELMIKGVDQLQRHGVISKSSSKWSNGRKWRFNTRVLDSLEKQAQQDKFAKAVQFKKELDQAFRAGEKKKRVTYLTSDGMIMALLNLQANGRVRIETTGQPNVPMGHEPGNYETRKYTKKYLHFRLDVVPTESYVYNEVVANHNDHCSEDTSLADFIARVKAARPPTKGPDGAVPVWCDVFGKVHTERWLKYLSAVLITLASRGSMRAPDVVKTLKPIIMLFEAEMIMEWAEELGLLKAQLEGCAPAVMEWWWMAIEAQREGLRTPAPAEVEFSAPTGPVTVTGGKQRKALPSSRPSRVVEGV